jgi:hypothetical protein
MSAVSRKQSSSSFSAKCLLSVTNWYGVYDDDDGAANEEGN